MSLTPKKSICILSNLLVISHRVICSKPDVIVQHSGHIATKTLGDTVDITSWHNSLFGQINNLVCYFGKLGHVTKQSLMYSCSSSLYGSVLWNLANPIVQYFCVALKRGLRRL